MEDLFVYKVDPSEVKPGAVIEGIDEIEAVAQAWKCFIQGRKEYWDGHRDTLPEKPKVSVQEVAERYPVAAAYRYAEKWVNSGDPIKVRLGKQAQVRLLDGDAPETVRADMRNGMAAFKLAQEG